MCLDLTLTVHTVVELLVSQSFTQNRGVLSVLFTVLGSNVKYKQFVVNGIKLAKPRVCSFYHFRYLKRKGVPDDITVYSIFS